MTFNAPDSLTEKIAQYLAEKIINGELAPKERIQEQKIASELEVSRGSVREALLLLERRYLINIIPRRGAVVTEITPHHVRALYEMVIDLYSLVAVKVANAWQDETEIQPFMDALASMQQQVHEKDVALYVESSFQIMQMADPLVANPYLREIIENLQPAVERTFNLALSKHREEIEQSQQFFEGILKGVLARDPDLIRQTISSYGNHNRDLVLSIIENNA